MSIISRYRVGGKGKWSLSRYDPAEHAECANKTKALKRVASS